MGADGILIGMQTPPVTNLFRAQHKVRSIFDLLGDDENSLTASLGWGLAQCGPFLSRFIRELLRVSTIEVSNATIYLQRYGKEDQGFTDIEVISPGSFHVIIEAKKGWGLPSPNQLAGYAKRFDRTHSRSIQRHLAVLTECGDDYARSCLGITELRGVPVTVITWSRVLRLLQQSISSVARQDRRLLGELGSYLSANMSAESQHSNQVFVVALSDKTERGWGISWIDIVEKRKCYFHPVGNGFPKQPPNYIAFRYRGRLQSIHHIDRKDVKVTANLHAEFPEIPANSTRIREGEHFIYPLGPAIKPPHIVRSGNIRNRHVFCDIDTLLTSHTIIEAEQLSKAREKAWS